MPLVPVRVKPEKVATPLVMVAVDPAVMAPPLPLKIVAVIVPDALVTTLPPESATLATGCAARATPLVAVVDGWVVMRICEAAPRVTLMLVCVT